MEANGEEVVVEEEEEEKGVGKRVGDTFKEGKKTKVEEGGPGFDMEEGGPGFVGGGDSKEKNVGERDRVRSR